MPSPESIIYKQFKTIDAVTADLSTIQELNLKEYILNEICDAKVQDVVKQYDFNSGTVLKIIIVAY
jgi:hypothetical protein